MTALRNIIINAAANEAQTVRTPAFETGVAPVRAPEGRSEAPVTWEAEADSIQARNIAQGFLPIRPARPFMSFERSAFENKAYPRKLSGTLEARLAALPPEKMNIREAVSAFTARTGRKPADPDEVLRIAREAGVREISYNGLYHSFEHEGYLSVVKNGRAVF